MACLVFLVLLLAMAGHSNMSSITLPSPQQQQQQQQKEKSKKCATWCVCKEGMGDSVLQKSLDYACGAGADCNPIHSAGSCYNPNTVRAHCNYAVNSYFQKKGQAQGSCDFSGTATVSTSDPSTTGCVYPTSASSTTPTSTTPVTTTPTTPTTTTPSSTTTPISGSPYVTTPSTGVVGTGLGPSGVGINTDMSHGGLALQTTSFFSFWTTTSLFSVFMLLWG